MIPATSTGPAPVNILIVDDNADNRVALRAVLACPAYAISEAATSSQALRELLVRDYALVLLDVVMPDMNGFELAELIHARPRTATVPILFVTGQASELNLVVKGYRVGAVDYLIKPLVPDIVRAKVSVFVQLYRQRLLLEAGLREKEILLREIHHRVKNNLQIITSLLHLQARMQGAEVQALFSESETRVRSIALVHERLYLAGNLASINAEAYLGELAQELLRTYGSTRTLLEIKAEPIVFPIDAAIPCGLIVNELVSNALKYAFPDDRSGTITVTLTEEPPDEVILEVRDDGVGVAGGLDIEGARTTGLQLVGSLAKQLRGTLAVTTDGGVAVRVTFPRPHA